MRKPRPNRVADKRLKLRTAALRAKSGQLHSERELLVEKAKALQARVHVIDRKRRASAMEELLRLQVRYAELEARYQALQRAYRALKRRREP